MGVAHGDLKSVDMPMILLPACASDLLIFQQDASPPAGRESFAKCFDFLGSRAAGNSRLDLFLQSLLVHTLAFVTTGESIMQHCQVRGIRVEFQSLVIFFDGFITATVR